MNLERSVSVLCGAIDDTTEETGYDEYVVKDRIAAYRSTAVAI